ncbi:MAG: hypothetical protein HS115_13995 [Spirochaetales bacterium]|nr:hypothetical protein [Spirochaetales bacterium]
MIPIRSALAFAALCLILPGVLGFISYYGFTPSYTTGVYSRDSFESQYESGIYRFRWLGREFLRLSHDYVKSRFPEPPPVSDRLKILDETASERFYAAYFLEHTFFFILFSISYYILLSVPPFAVAERIKILILLTVQLLISIAQYVVTPYDSPSFFFSVLALVMLTRRNVGGFAVGCLLIAVSTLIRESSSLALAFFLAYHLLSLKGPLSFRIQAMGPLLLRPLLAGVSFVLPYLGLRFYFGWDSATAAVMTCKKIPQIPNLYGLYFGVAMAVLLYSMAENRSQRLFLFLFWLFCLPYIVYVLLFGMLFEIRLFLPLIFLGMVIVFQPQEKRPAPINDPL